MENFQSESTLQQEELKSVLQPIQNNNPPKRYFKNIWVLIVGIVVLIVLSFVVIIFVGGNIKPTLVQQKPQNTLQNLQVKITPRPTLEKTPLPSISAGKIVAINSKNPDYSFKFPYPQYGGGFDGLGGVPPGYISEEIYNQGTPGPESWIIQYVSIKNGTEAVGPDWSIPNSSFFETLAMINVNQTSQITDDLNHKLYSFTRLEDNTIDGVSARIYQSNHTTGHGSQTKYAIFTKNNYLYLLSVEWTSSVDNYIFNLVTSSFQFSLRPVSEVISY